MNTSDHHKVLRSLKSITYKYITYHFSNYLFDKGYLNFDWADDTDPDQISEDKLPAAKIPMEKLSEAMNDYWTHYARYYAFYLYQNLESYPKNDLEVMDYVSNQAKLDIINSITCLCTTGKIYQTQFFEPEEVVLFTGTTNKTLAEHYADLDIIAMQKFDKYLFFEFMKKIGQYGLGY